MIRCITCCRCPKLKQLTNNVCDVLLPCFNLALKSWISSLKALCIPNITAPSYIKSKSIYSNCFIVTEIYRCILYVNFPLIPYIKYLKQWNLSNKWYFSGFPKIYDKNEICQATIKMLQAWTNVYSDFQLLQSSFTCFNHSISDFILIWKQISTVIFQ